MCFRTQRYMFCVLQLAISQRYLFETIAWLRVHEAGEISTV